MTEDERNMTGDGEKAEAPAEEKKETETRQSENEGREEFLEEDSSEVEEDKKEQKKMKMVLGFGIGILILAVVILSGCVVYSQQMNQKLASQTEKLKEEYTKLRQDMMELVSSQAAASEETDAKAPTSTPAPTPTPTVEAEPTKPVENNFDAVENNMKEKRQESGETDPKPEPTVEPSTTPTDQNPKGEEGEKVITIPENTEKFVTYEHYIEGKKFSFEYPSEWDGKVIFSNVTNEDGTVVITCYQSGQYSDFQNGALETGEIFHILVNKDPVYQSEANNQYKIGEKDGYCAYYEEPSGVTYDYVNHKEYAEDYKLVYESQAKVWRSFQFNL